MLNYASKCHKITLKVINIFKTRKNITIAVLSLKWKHKLGLRCQENASEGCFFPNFSGGDPPHHVASTGALHQASPSKFVAPYSVT
jgi:hypothetical protein